MSLIIVNETVFIRAGDAVGWSIRPADTPAPLRRFPIAARPVATAANPDSRYASGGADHSGNVRPAPFPRWRHAA